MIKIDIGEIFYQTGTVLYLKCKYSGLNPIKLITRNQHDHRLGWTIGLYVLGKFTTKVSSIEPNSGIDRYHRNQVSNQH